MDRNKRYFSVEDVCKRWFVTFEFVMLIFSEHKILVYSVDIPKSKDNSIDPKLILVPEEDIIRLERQLKIPHSKLKSKKLILKKESK